MSAPDHRAVIAGIAPEERVALTTLSNGPGLIHLVAHLGLIAVIGILIAMREPYWPLLMLPQGIFIIFLFTALHEATHETAFRSAALNKSVAALCGFLVVVPPNWFRYFHFAHHRHTQDQERDPELMAKKPETIWDYVRYLSGLPLWWSAIKTLVLNALGRSKDDYVPARGRAAVVNEARIMLVLYAALGLGSVYLQRSEILWVWLLPILIGQPFLRAYLLAEHARCPLVANMFENTRTTFTTAAIRFLAWNMPYHAEHHAYPVVPFHKLPALHRLTRAHLKTTEDGYLRFHQKFAESLTPGDRPTA
jgi:fatty acid desaturase